MMFVIIILVALWLPNYIKFRQRHKIERMMCEFTRHIYDNEPGNPMAAIEYGSALMLCQQYKSALKLFEGVKNRIANANLLYPYLDANIEFCNKPLPWSKGAKNYRSRSWWHNFQLVRFGNRRQVAICNDTVLAFNSMLRMMNR